MGEQDQGAWHLPRSGTLLARPLRQSQRTALALWDVAAAYSLGWPRLGSDIPNRPGSFRAIRATAPAATQEAHRLGSPDLAADRAMVARAANHLRHCQQLCGDCFTQRGAPADLHDHPPA